MNCVKVKGSEREREGERVPPDTGYVIDRADQWNNYHIFQPYKNDTTLEGGFQ